MLQILHDTNFPFMKYRRLAYFFSGTIIIATLAFLAIKGPKLGVDFRGGSLLQVRISPPQQGDAVRAALDAGGFKGAQIQQMQGAYKDEFLVSSADSVGVFPRAKAAIEAHLPGAKAELRGLSYVGSKVGKDLKKKAVMAILSSLGIILLYVGWRYEFKYSLGGVVALLHDVIVTLGFLCFTGREITLTVIAALLTIAGYSINDTIVVFDRIRERNKALRKETHSRVMDIAVNETLSRTVITAFTVFLTALALFIWGGEVLRDFSFAMLVGTVFGTYSSVYVASALALDIWISLDRRKGVPAE